MHTIYVNRQDSYRYFLVANAYGTNINAQFINMFGIYGTSLRCQSVIYTNRRPKWHYLFYIHLFIHTYIMHTQSHIFLFTYKNYQQFVYTVCLHGIYMNTHSGFSCSTGFSSLYLFLIQPQRGCLWSPHPSPEEAVNHSCRCSGGSGNPCLLCGYTGCYRQMSGYYPGCLYWCHMGQMVST